MIFYKSYVIELTTKDKSLSLEFFPIIKKKVLNRCSGWLVVLTYWDLNFRLLKEKKKKLTKWQTLIKFRISSIIR